MNLYAPNGIIKTCYDRESTSDWLNSRCGHSMQPETMFDHKQDLLPDDFQSIVLTVGVDRIDDSHNSNFRPNFINKQAYLGLNTP
jgi:hypothetical protein